MATKRIVDLERGERIKYVRTQLLDGLSQEQLAVALSAIMPKKITRGAVGNWELGKEFGVVGMLALARLADISVEWLGFGRGEKPLARGELASFGKISGVDNSAEEIDHSLLEEIKKQQAMEIVRTMTTETIFELVAEASTIAVARRGG